MEQSPLVQQIRPDVLKPKIVELYESLFAAEVREHSEGFWREFFLLKPDQASLRSILSKLSPEQLLRAYQSSTQQLFSRATKQIRAAVSPSDEIALDTLTVFLDTGLNKRYTSPSPDIIAVLAGLEGVDVVFGEFVAALESSTRDGRTQEIRQKAVRVAIAQVAGAYQTGLTSYFVSRDQFPALMKLLQDADPPHRGFGALLLLSLLCNWNKFEFQNPYRLRLEDFVNESIMVKIVGIIGAVCNSSRDEYLAVQDDQQDTWRIGGALSYLGLGALTARPISLTNGASDDKDKDKITYAALPPPEAAILLITYDFTYANSLFAIKFVTSPAFGDYLSFVSYLLQIAHTSARGLRYSYLSLITLQVLLEDPTCARSIAGGEGEKDTKLDVRLCRQRPPLLPLVRGGRVPAAVILDIIIDGLNHNLSTALDIELYHLLLLVLLRLVAYLGRSRTRLTYHFSQLFGTLTAFLRFFSTNVDALKPLPNIYVPFDLVLCILALCVTTSDVFLPDTGSLDDLHISMLEIQDVLGVLRQPYNVSSRPAPEAALQILEQVAAHFKSFQEEKRTGGWTMKLPGQRELRGVVRNGYESLKIDVEGMNSIGNWERYREIDQRSLLKRIVRVAVVDTRMLLMERGKTN